MSTSLNKVMLIGHIGRAPDIRTTPDGLKICNFSLATSEHWKDKMTGDKKTKTEWHRIVVINDRLIDFIDQYVRKGMRVYVEGQLNYRKWKDREDIEHVTTEITISRFNGELILVDKISESENEPSLHSVEEKNNATVATETLHKTYQKGGPKPIDYNDDDIPF